MPTVPDALKIDRGEGRFGDADGLVASQFKVDEYGDAIDNQIGAVRPVWCLFGGRGGNKL